MAGDTYKGLAEQADALTSYLDTLLADLRPAAYPQVVNAPEFGSVMLHEGGDGTRASSLKGRD